MAQIFVPSVYVGGPCAIIDVCEDGSMVDVVTIVNTNYEKPSIFTTDMGTLNSLVDSLNETFRNQY